MEWLKYYVNQEYQEIDHLVIAGNVSNQRAVCQMKQNLENTKLVQIISCKNWIYTEIPE